ncbi:MAG: hypothetical protein K5686_00790 [Lachnospiraceae bacterium]|nr:hypothetical protein [Lachnospiraceae bacterium]
MVEQLFENRFILTRKLHREYYREFYRRNGRNIKIISTVLACISAAIFLLFVILFRSAFAATFFLVLSVYFFLMIPYGYVFREWIGYRGLKRDHEASAIFQIVSFCRDRIHVKVNKLEFDIAYDQLDGLMETEELWILLLKGKNGLQNTQLLWKKGFKDKSEEGLKEFFGFINDKGRKSIFAAGE